VLNIYTQCLSGDSCIIEYIGVQNAGWNISGIFMTKKSTYFKNDYISTYHNSTLQQYARLCHLAH